MSDTQTIIDLDFESTTKNYYRYGSKKQGYIITVYMPKINGDKPKSVKVVIDNG